MKRQMKIAAVVSATALLAIGASFTSMAALKTGTWVNSEDGWRYVDREGEYVEEEWCYSNGVQFWVNEDGVLGSSEWVTDDSHTYYVQSDGSMTTNAWKYLFAEDEEDDADAEEAWFYFDAKGRMVTSAAKKQIGSNYYYFDEDGKMLTGWVHKEGKYELDDAESVGVKEVAYCDEDGALVRNAWVNTFPWTEDSDECYEGDDEEWYYTNSDGTPRSNTTRTINGLKYIFGADGAMLTEWVVYDGNTYKNADEDNGFTSADAEAVYYCDADDGHVKVDGWRELDDPTEDDTYWYYFDKTGKAFLATDANATMEGYLMLFEDGETHKVTVDSDAYLVNTKKIGSTYYYFNEKAEMLSGLVQIDGKLMYLADGARKTGKVTLTDDNENDYTFFFGDENNSSEGYEKYVAVTGNMDGYLYDNGQLVKSDDSDLYLTHTVTNPIAKESATFVVDYRGKIMHKDNKDYEGAGKFTFNADNKGWNEDCIK